MRADNRRIDGWLAVKEWLKPYEAKDEQTGEIRKTSRLKIFSNCVNLIRCLPQVQRDEKDANDVADQPHELTHSVDALRYFCIMRTRPTIEAAKKKRDDFHEQRKTRPQTEAVDASYLNYGNGGY
jgi:phage terminase large subunit